MNREALVGASLLLLVTACGDQAPRPTGIAPTDQAVTSRADTARPRLRLDMSDVEKQRFYDAHAACLRASDPAAANGGRYSEEAWRACAELWPLPPWEMDPDNPAFEDDWRRTVRCLNERGMKVVELGPGSWTYDGEQALGPEDRRRVEEECEQEVFGAGAR